MSSRQNNTDAYLQERAKRLHQEFLKTVKVYNLTEAKLVKIISDINEDRLFEELGFSTIVDYVSEHAGWSKRKIFRIDKKL